ncbi:hypothetical protein DFH07DRAFT_955969 [Mycena maculata]|uniref:Uncharacterized protein n=1 Tax=Mycena maculata TaxID=230809 RepID=A0AAD7NK74_9AGAR|nr:hypothetical protein DFH07DRAFT_955969 [Mycena maculata]
MVVLNHTTIQSLQTLNLSKVPVLFTFGKNFDAPALTDLVVRFTYGDQISAFVDDACGCDDHSGIRPALQTISLRRFPLLSSLTLVNQCFTDHVISGILDLTSQQWLSLKAVSICPEEDKLEDLYVILQEVVRSRRRSLVALP